MKFIKLGRRTVMGLFKKKQEYIYYTRLVANDEYELVGPFNTQVDAVMHKHEGLLMPGEEILDENTKLFTSKYENWAGKRFLRTGGIFVESL
jgi:hypothetical protein